MPLHTEVDGAGPDGQLAVDPLYANKVAVVPGARRILRGLFPLKARTVLHAPRTRTYRSFDPPGVRTTLPPVHGER